MAETQGSQRERGRAAGDGNGCDGQHPAWCSPEHCLVTEDGVRFHGQAPVRWEDHEAGVRFESQLFDPTDDENTYVETDPAEPEAQVDVPRDPAGRSGAAAA